MQTDKISFTGAFGDTLSAKLDYPDKADEVKGWVLFAHGFSIGKDLKPIRTISKALVEEGYGMLRFDFTGLGQSEGFLMSKPSPLLARRVIQRISSINLQISLKKSKKKAKPKSFWEGVRLRLKSNFWMI